jgi:hypothetical protein
MPEVVIITVNNKAMKLKKGSKEAKAYMAKIRAKRGTKKVGTKKLTTKKVGSAENKVYIEFMNSSKNFKTEKKYFKTYEDAVNFMYANFEKVNLDMINYVKPKKVGSALKLNKKETRLGIAPKTTAKKGNNYHKDTKSHNVNIRVISGFSKFVKHKGFTIDVIKLSNGKNEYAVYQVSPATNKEVYYGSYLTLKAAKEWINRSLYLLKNALK